MKQEGEETKADKKVSLINGSPRGAKASSLLFLHDLGDLLEKNGIQSTVYTICLSNDRANSRELLEAMRTSDSLIFSFPLYAYTLPAAFTQLLEEYGEYVGHGGVTNKAPLVYAFVNSGYPVPRVNEEALRVMQLYCIRFGFNWRFGAGIGGGLIVAMTRRIPLINRKLRQTYKRIIEDIIRCDISAYETAENVWIRPVLPKPVMLYMKDSKLSKRMMKRIT